MSVDWSEYATPKDTRARARKPTDNAILAMIAGRIRVEAGLAVNHTPVPENQSHSEITLPESDEDLTEARIKLGRIASIAIPLND
jgi:hypothetical protein